MGDIVSGTKILNKRTVNYVVGGPYTLVVYNPKTKEVEHLLEDETGLTEFAIEETALAMECTDKKEFAQTFIAAKELTIKSKSDELMGATK
jgi:hypothetical protein